MYWPWQTVLALVLLIAITIVVLIAGPLWFSKRHTTFFSCRSPLYVGLTCSYNYVVCATILLQIILEYSALEEERMTGQPSTAHFPCDVMLAVSTLNYTLFAIPNTLMTATVCVRFYTRYRTTPWRYVLRRTVVYATLAAGFAFTVSIFLILKFSLNQYRSNSSGLQCSYSAEWFVYWPLNFVILFATVGFKDAVKGANDLYLIGAQLRYGVRLIGLLSQVYMLMQCILGSLSWAGSIDRTAMEARGLPFDVLALVMHTCYFYNVIIRPLMWHRQWQQEYELSENSKRTSGTRSSYLPSNLVSETRRASDQHWLSDLSDDDEQNDDSLEDGLLQRPDAKTVGARATGNLSSDIVSSTTHHRPSSLERNIVAPPTPVFQGHKRDRSTGALSYSDQRPIPRHSLASINVDEQQQTPSLLPATGGPLFLRRPSGTQVRHGLAPSNAVAPTGTPQQLKRQGSLLRLASIKWTCLRVLRDPRLFTAFEAHAQRTLNGENTEFWKECEAYRTLWHAHRQHRRATRTTATSALSDQGHIVIDVPNPLDLPIDKSEFCSYMYGKYVKTNAAFQLNISDTLRKRYKDAMDGKLQSGSAASADQTASPITSAHKQREQLLFALLSEVQRECYKLLDTNVWRTFRTSEQFKKLSGDDANDVSETEVAA